MTQESRQQSATYLNFSQRQWAHLRDSVPLTLTDQDLDALRGINEQVSLKEVSDIYLPLSRLLNLIVNSQQSRGVILEKFLGKYPSRRPYIISIAGSVAVGKSTTARILQALLQRWPEHPKVDLVTTDGFLYPLEDLKQRELLHRKGFPESYDVKHLVEFVAAIKSGEQGVTAPVYSHVRYDRIPGKEIEINQPDILILEGLNVLQNAQDAGAQGHSQYVSDYVDFSIYVDAPQNLLKQWYIERFLQFRDTAFSRADSYFNHYANLSDEQAFETAGHIWDTINGPNLVQNILPTRERASLILKKGPDHLVQQVLLSK
ncbi:type I pantothenate kinase [Paraferrimonas sedimenticola]|uniref:Pantothenate kinase n=1 Tax=Paraferrimonas sedimenticola TaxID=375674 RepID=A0AA37RYR1_9GAMM|nr:type I pantothenate kinase [Paraferrimonas sedimenticola]GLP97759.1 pantothenate kinase [Paraferrimonas sedimenticola]